MDDRTRAATYQDLLHVAELLEQERVEYAVIGGYALALQGIVRLTEDVDILLKMKEHGRLKDRADAEAIRKALQSNDS
jgi:hypothetical protein